MQPGSPAKHSSSSVLSSLTRWSPAALQSALYRYATGYLGADGYPASRSGLPGRDETRRAGGRDKLRHGSTPLPPHITAPQHSQTLGRSRQLQAALGPSRPVWAGLRFRTI